MQGRRFSPWRRGALVLATLVAAVAARPATAHATTPEPTRVRATPVSVAGAPRSVVTLMVPVPARLQELPRLHFQVVMSGAVEVIGRLEGELTPATGSRSIILTLRVPATALVGLLDVADVVFTTSDGSAVEVPIILRVPGIYALRVTGVRELAALDRGDRIELSYQVQNLGNDTERLKVDVLAPKDWLVRLDGGDGIVVPPYATKNIVLRFRVPAVQSTGSFAVGVRLGRTTRPDSLPAGTAITQLRVVEQVESAEVLSFHPFVGGAVSGDGSAIATGLRVTGPVTEGVRLDAQFAPQGDARGLSLFGLNSVGVARIPFTASLRARDWSAQFGVARAELPQLTGYGFGGRGGSATVRRGDTEYHVVAAAPAADRGRSGQMLGAAVRRATGFGDLGLSLASMEYGVLGATAARRELNAIGIEWGSATLFGDLDLKSGLALRQHANGTGLGASLDAFRRWEGGQAHVAALFAPGGTAAFAPAERRISASASQQVGERLWLDANLMTNSDGQSVFRETRFNSSSFGARQLLREDISVSARVGHDVSRALGGVTGGSGGFESRQTYVASGVGFDLGDWNLSLDGRLTQVERETQLFSGARDERSAPQRAVTAFVSRGFGLLGNFSFGSSYVASGEGIGLPDAALTAQAQWNEFPLIVGEQVIRLSEEVSAVRTSLLAPRVAFRTLARTTVAGLDITGSFERTPFLTDRRGRPAWIFGLRVALSSQLLTSDRLLTPGSVYRDDNGNGRRDADEPGVAGVELTHDRLRVTTNRRGEYRVPQSVRGQLRVDATSIPTGMVLHPRQLADTVEQREIPLLPTTTLTVTLEQEASEASREAPLDFDKVDLWLRDADGFEWVGRHLGAGRFAFEHVPVGNYSLRTAFTRSGQQLRTDDVTVTLRRDHAPSLTVPVRGRNVRIITPPSQGRGRVGPRNGGAGQGQR